LFFGQEKFLSLSRTYLFFITYKGNFSNSTFWFWLIQVGKEEKDFLFKPSEIFLIHSLSLVQRKLNGDYAEVGVYRGSCAKIICEAKGDERLYLFDTFEGLADTNIIDTQFSKN